MASISRSSWANVGVPVGIGSSAAAYAEPTGGAFLQLMFAAGMIFISGAFTLQLAHDNESGGFVGSAILGMVTALTGILGVLLTLTSRNALRSLIRFWPLLALVALAFLSTAWSFDRSVTLRRSVALLSTVLFVLAMVMRLSPTQCIRLIVRVMVLECALSIVWVALFPDAAIHQLTDPGQTQHAGAWRGIFSHKNQLGLFAGLTAGLLTFYGSLALRSPIFTILGILCAIVCLLGAGSMTGWLTMFITAGILYLLYGIATRLAEGVRNLALNLLLIAILFVCLLWIYDFLAFLPMLLGKSSDISGRTDYWDIAMDVFYGSGATLLGGGYFVGLSFMFPEFVYVDNGHIHILLQFGYLGSALVVAFVFWLLFAGKRLVVRTSRELVMQDIFPMAIVLVLAFENIAETNFLWPKHLSVVLTVLAVAIAVQRRQRPPRYRPGSVSLQRI